MSTRTCQTTNLLVRRLTETSRVPTRGSEGAAGYDLYADEDVDIEPGGRALVSTGISVEVPPGTYGRIAPRSGLAVTFGIQVGAGVVDRDYRGEVRVLLFHCDSGSESVGIRRGDRIAQMILECCKTPYVNEVTEASAMTETVRGDAGFGSTGL